MGRWGGSVSLWLCNIICIFYEQMKYPFNWVPNNLLNLANFG